MKKVVHEDYYMLLFTIAMPRYLDFLPYCLAVVRYIYPSL